jgi:hypothetical protein
MKKYSIESTVKTPSISLDFGTGVLEVKGRTFPENAIEFSASVRVPRNVCEGQLKFNKITNPKTPSPLGV